MGGEGGGDHVVDNGTEGGRGTGGGGGYVVACVCVKCRVFIHTFLRTAKHFWELWRNNVAEELLRKVLVARAEFVPEPDSRFERRLSIGGIEGIEIGRPGPHAVRTEELVRSRSLWPTRRTEGEELVSCLVYRDGRRMDGTSVRRLRIVLDNFPQQLLENLLS